MRSEKKTYDINYSWKAFTLKKDEITMAGYKEYLKLKQLIQPQRKKYERKSK